MGTLIQDVRYGVRMLRKNPGFTAVVILTLAVGIGANTALFSVVDAILLRQLPYRDPQQLVAIHDDVPGLNMHNVGTSVQELDDLRDRSGIFEQVSPVWPINVNVTGREKPARVEGLAVGENYFNLLGSKAALGRVFTSTDYRPGFFEGAVISDSLWRRMFGASSSVLGQGIRLDTDLYTIVGVMPPTFRHPGRTLQSDVDVWITAGYIAAPFPQPPKREIRMFPGVIARLKPGITVPQAQSRLNDFVAQLSEQYPNEYPKSARWDVRLTPLHDEVVGTTGPMLFVLLAAVGVVLLIACVNIASLLLARSSGRNREIAVRRALGAGAVRVIRQMLTESVLLSLIGGICAIFLSFLLKDVLLQLVPASVPRLQEVTVNLRVLLFTLSVSLVAGIAFGLAPALQLARPRLVESLGQGSRTSGLGLSHHRFLSTLVISEFAMSLVLLVGAGLLLRSFRNVLQVNAGFNTDHIVVAHIWLPVPNDPNLNPYQKQDKRAVFVREVLRRVNALPGINGATIATGSTPFSSPQGLTNFSIEGTVFSSGESPVARIGSLTPDFEKVLGMTLVRGRTFVESDNETGERVALIDQTAAERYWPNQDPIGKRVQLTIPGAINPVPFSKIVGVVARTRSEGLDVAYTPHIFFPAYQAVGIAMSIYARTPISADALQDPMRAAVQSVDPNLPVFAVRTMEGMVSDSLASRRFALQLMALFAATALLLAAIGIYGVTAYFVTQRVREIGIRMALGAQPGDVLKLIVSRGMILATIGVGLGIVTALAVAHLISGLLFGVSSYDPITLAALTFVLGAVALLANYIPARRAAQVDPMVALRYE